MRKTNTYAGTTEKEKNNRMEDQHGMLWNDPISNIKIEKEGGIEHYIDKVSNQEVAEWDKTRGIFKTFTY